MVKTILPQKTKCVENESNMVPKPTEGTSLKRLSQRRSSAEENKPSPQYYSLRGLQGKDTTGREAPKLSTIEKPQVLLVHLTIDSPTSGATGFALRVWRCLMCR